MNFHALDHFKWIITSCLKHVAMWAVYHHDHHYHHHDHYYTSSSSSHIKERQLTVARYLDIWSYLSVLLGCFTLLQQLHLAKILIYFTNFYFAWVQGANILLVATTSFWKCVVLEYFIGSGKRQTQNAGICS